MKPLILLLLAAIVGIPQSSQACTTDCATMMPVTLDSGWPLVLVRLNGQSVRMVFDTGSERTAIGEELAQRLHLPADPAATSRAWSIGGSSLRRDAVAQSLAFGAISLGPIALMVVPMAQLGGGNVDGILGNDVLERYDVLLDLPHQQVALFQPQGGSADGPRWADATERLPIVPRDQAPHLPMIQVELDGTRQNAVIDTGTGQSLIDRARAARGGLSATPRTADVVAHDEALNAIAVQLHRFHRLAIGSEITSDPLIGVIDLPDPDGRALTQMLLGGDWLLHHKLWISHGNSAVYVAHPAPAR